jgi:hypothetical protein
LIIAIAVGLLSLALWWSWRRPDRVISKP